MIAADYLSIIGQVITIASTIIVFTKFSQKKFLLGIHLLYFLIFFIVGLIGLLGSSEYVEKMMGFPEGKNTDIKECLNSDLDCQISPHFNLYRS